MQVPDEVVSVLLGQSHEGPAHHDELHLVHAVTQLLQLHVKQNTRKVFKQFGDNETFYVLGSTVKCNGVIGVIIKLLGLIIISCKIN